MTKTRNHWPARCLHALAMAMAVAVTTPAARAEVLPADEPSAASQEAVARRLALGRLQEAQVREKLRAVLASPDFSTEETMRIPALKKRAAEDPPDWMKYVERFGRLLARILRAGVWILGAIAVVVLAVSLYRWYRIAASSARANEISIPTHVGELDIRAASLPDDVGAAAWMRWQAGDVTGSLSLLYRGALSVLVLRHEAPIRSSFTEAECLRAAKRCLPGGAAAYFESLTRAWLQTVYAGRRPDDTEGRALCDGFAAHFSPVNSAVPASTAAGPARGAAA